MVPDNRREAVEQFADPQLAKALELLLDKKQLQAKSTEKKTVEQSEPKEELKNTNLEEKPESDPGDTPRDQDKSVDKPE